MFYQKKLDVESCKNFLEDRFNHQEYKIFIVGEDNIIGFVHIYPVFSTVSLQRAYILNDPYVHSSHRSSGQVKN
ncbi:hypothetical protein [Macrococcus hajekii]|uniref:hypothetical protein n=1 Tax=Macrococcus hajekii TaxID=198482 RepID=UPI001665A433|nr:hypothetical protein [Macrococcus hajekii]